MHGENKNDENRKETERKMNECRKRGAGIKTKQRGCSTEKKKKNWA